MTTLVIGGAASGKSEYAESLLVSAKKKLYIATMQPFGQEAQQRIKRHRSLRARKGFETLERFTALGDLTDAELPDGCSVLLECLGNLVANELFSPDGAKEEAENAILDGMKFLAGRCRHLVVVTNDVFSDGITYDADTERYLTLLGCCNAMLAAQFDAVVEVVCGIPIVLKGATT
ncbi:bifunctional adenosylcobinamide kinase/adenosylcobinamide-phosphate guanylyltransferase [Oscillospiraceae bacterium LTW-04]|nr:bifunctional adenosylcobinamide kinase/adenosylcobinamide-phosphate guanylyltransferase [Oscillospiraceae bacterium MB24-C1]